MHGSMNVKIKVWMFQQKNQYQLIHEISIV